jgi:tetratricopeptide (TPR) repeat protein
VQDTHPNPKTRFTLSTHWRRTLRRAARGLTCGAIVSAPLALGGAHATTNLVLALVITLTLGAVVITASEDAPVQMNDLLWLILIALVAALFQLTPLPRGILTALSPEATGILTIARGEAFSSAPLTLDIPATAHEVLKLLIALGLTIIIPSLFPRSRHQRQLMVAIGVAGFAVLFTGLLHMAFGLHKPFGIYGASLHPMLTSSFINPNHAASFLGLVSLLSLGEGLARGDSRRWLWLGNGALTGAGVLLTLSRGGVLVYLFCLALLGALMGWQQRRSAPSHRAGGALMGVSGVIAALIACLARTEWIHEMWTLGNENVLNKFQAWSFFTQLVRDYPLSGVGRGAMQSVFYNYASREIPLSVQRLENEWLQLLVDLGVPTGALLLMGCLYLFQRAAATSLNHPRTIGMVTALVFVGLHNLVDFSLTLSALLIPTVILFSLLLSRSERVRPRPDPTSSLLSRPLGAAALAALALLTFAGGTLSWGQSLEEDFARLKTHSRKERALDNTLGAIIARHPADVFLPLQAAFLYLHPPRDPGRALHWVNRAMHLNHNSFEAHYLAAQALHYSDYFDQAGLEYRLACTLNPHKTSRLAQLAFSMRQRLSDVEGLASPDPVVLRRLAGFLLQKGAPLKAHQLLTTPLVDTDADALYQRAQVRVQLQRFDKAREDLELAITLLPQSARHYLLLASIFVTQGAPDEGLSTLQRGIHAGAPARALWLKITQVHLSAREYPLAREAARKLILYSHDANSTADAHWRLGDIHRRMKNRMEALREFLLARDMAFAKKRYHLSVAKLREEMGDLVGAAQAMDTLPEEFKTSQDAQALTRRLQEKLHRLRMSSVGLEIPL